MEKINMGKYMLEFSEDELSVKLYHGKELLYEGPNDNLMQHEVNAAMNRHYIDNKDEDCGGCVDVEECCGGACEDAAKTERNKVAKEFEMLKSKVTQWRKAYEGLVKDPSDRKIYAEDLNSELREHMEPYINAMIREGYVSKDMLMSFEMHCVREFGILLGDIDEYPTPEEEE